MAENKKGAGRPAKQTTADSTPEERALANLQYSMDRAASYTVDHKTISILGRSARCARLGIDKSVPLAAVAAIEQACAEARAAIEDLYSQPEEEEPAQAPSRANLAALVSGNGQEDSE